MNVVVVESPAKAKTINKYLGSDYRVLASFGHVRDLPSKDGSVRPDEDFAMSWEVDGRGEKQLKEIAAAVRNASRLYLATDPDREGEAISWHVLEELKRRRVLSDVDVKRVVFHEITRSAIQDAMEHPRDLDHALIEAYLARRALDYLVGFTLSPVLWRKVPGARSAGRVQSVALRLVCEREAEIEAFRPREYWTVETMLANAAGAAIPARLTRLDGAKLDRFDIATADAAEAAAARVRAGAFAVAQIERKTVRRHPAPPFTTSTLQQEASRKLRFAASQTMRLAQRLYEGIDIDGETVGLITYMRTDSVTLSQEAVGTARSLIGERFEDRYLPASPRRYQTRSKNAQEAHEAIRPTDIRRDPKAMARHLDGDMAALYELVWKRTLASQMESAEIDQVAVDFAAENGNVVVRATGSVIRFDGFLKLYHEDRDDESDAAEDGEKRLPDVAEGESVSVTEVRPEQHFTQPPPRYSEASLVKKLEELGIGRPSTYASILQVLQDRNYVQLDRRRFVPEDRGRIVTAFLENFFKRYVEYDFTAELENQLDEVSNGGIDWREVLRRFWTAFSAAVGETSQLRIADVVDALDRELGPHFFVPKSEGDDPRKCPSCDDGRLGLKLGRFGAFIGCSNYPECRYTRRLAVNGDDADGAGADEGPRLIGQHPETGQPITQRKGPYGLYLQLGEAEGGEKPKRVSLPKGVEPSAVDLETAVKLFALPRDVGLHPETGEMIAAGIGRYGPYLKHGKVYRNLEALDDVLTIQLNRAVSLLAEKPTRGGGGALRTLGDHPDDGKPVTVHKGRYGPYVKHGRTNATLPKDVGPEEVTLEQALPLLAAREQRKGSGSKAKAKTKAKTKTKTKAKAKAKTKSKAGAGSAPRDAAGADD